MKIKILAWGDYAAPTGFATVMSNIFKRLDFDKYDLDVIGINYNGDPDYDKARFPGRIWPARVPTQGLYSDLLGRRRVLEFIKENPIDVLFILNDTFMVKDIMPKIIELRTKLRKQFKIVYYYPIDSPPWIPWIRNSASLADVAVTYTQYGYTSSIAADEELEGKLKVVPHGIDTNDFYPYTTDGQEQVAQYRDFWFRAAKGKTLLLNVNRNQPRKDIPRSLLLLHELKKARDDIALYLHMSNDDIGGDLTPVANQLGLKKDVDYFIPSISPKGIPVEQLNDIYNMCDILITTTMGEGWGLSLTEAMATGLPVVAPDHTAVREILADARGLAVKSGSITSLWTTLSIESELVLRPLVDVEDMASKICWLIENDKERRLMVKRAYDWVRTLNWDSIYADHWEEILSAE